MKSDSTFVVVGAGQAGGKAVAAMRREGFKGRIVLIGDEVYLPYERPPLSKEVLTGSAQPLSSVIYDQEFYDEQGVELVLGSKVTGLDTEKCHVLIDGRPSIEYSKLLLTTGTRARELSIPGTELSNIFKLRTIDDVLALKPMLRAKAKVVLVGGGFIGLEVAASATQRGCKVTVLEAEKRLLTRGVPEQVANHIAQIHEAHGVKLLLGSGVSRFIGTGDGAVTTVVCKDGSEVEADVVVVGIGAVPNSEIAQAAGIDCDNGVLVDDCGRTSDPRVFAAGDVTNQYHSILKKRMRLESWDNAERQSIAAVKAMCDVESDKLGIPWFWTDQFDTNIQVMGYQPEGDQIIVRGEPDTGRFCIFTLASGRIVGAALVNSGAERRPILNLMEGGSKMDAAVLADSDVKLRSLMSK